MRFGIIVSKEDAAGKNIASFLEAKLPASTQLHFIEGNQCFANEVGKISAELFIFASLHKSESGKPALTTHAIGNWGKAEYGGKDKTLVPTNSFLLKNYLLALQKQKESLFSYEKKALGKTRLPAQGLEFEVCLEATHHGPFLEKPTVFIELGSSPKQWQDKQAAKAIAQAIISSTSTEGKFKSAIALGGTHYCPELSKLVLRTEWALGHICPQYALPSLDKEMLQKAIDATFPRPEAIILDWKGMGKEKQRINALLEGQELPVLRLQKLLR